MKNSYFFDAVYKKQIWSDTGSNLYFFYFCILYAANELMNLPQRRHMFGTLFIIWPKYFIFFQINSEEIDSSSDEEVKDILLDEINFVC